MKPLKLTMKNISAFTGRHTVDFSLLGDMFLICGKTGAGKTTILDAITYALYGSLPGARRQNDIRRLRSDFCGNKDECFVHFEFLLNGTRYRIERNLPVSRITRNGTLTEDGESAALFMCGKDGDTLISDKKSETDNRIKSLISLSAEEFSRIILLPQGDFAEFLRQNSTERKAMLSKLFPVERFTRITEVLKNGRAHLASMHEEVMQGLERIGSDFSEHTSEELQTEQKKRLKKAEKQSKDLNTEIFNLKLQIDKTERTECAYKEYEEVRTQLQILTAQTAENTKRQKKSEALNFALAAEPLLSAAERAEAHLHRVETQLESYSEQLALCIRTREELSEGKKTYAENQARLRQNILDTQKIRLALNAASDMKRALSAAAETERELENSRLQAEKIRTEADEAARAEEKQKQLQLEYENEKNNLQYAEYIFLRARENELVQSEQVLQSAVDRARLILEELLEDKAEEERLSQACIFAAQLAEGQACPVCGSTEHPFPAQKSPQRLDTEEKIQTQKTLTAEAEKNLEKIQDEKKELKGRIGQIASQLYTQSRNGQSLFSQSGTAEDDPIPDTKEASQKIENIRLRLFTIEQTLRDGEKKAAQKAFAQENLKQADKHCTEAEAKHAAAQARFQESEKLVQELLRDLGKTDLKNRFSGIDAKTEDAETLVCAIEQTADTLKNENAELERELRLYDEKNAQTEKIYAELTGTITALKTDKENRTKEYRERSLVFSQAAAKLPYEACAICGLIPNDGIRDGEADKEKNTDQCKQLIKSLVRDRTAAEQEARDLEYQIESYKTQKQKLEVLCGEKKAALWAFRADIESETPQEGELFSFEDLSPEPEAEKILAALAAERDSLLQKQREAETHLEENEALCTELRHLVAETEARVQEYKNLEKRRLELTEKLNIYTRLYSAVSGNNPSKLPLESWVLRMYLEEVCLCAGKRLERISDGRYTLYLKKPEGGKGFQGLDLEIYDSFTGKRRPCSTLSGGETFMASISLALAVSDTVQAKNGGIQLDALFIDEGFGTLDETSLEKALSVLDEIRANRCIGLVSHVGLLKTRIPARLEIEKGITGSTITCKIN